MDSPNKALTPYKRVMTTRFTKMHGLGNDFVVIEQPDAARPSLPSRTAQYLADRRRGIGCDQVIVLEPSRAADRRMRIFNPDGSEAQACGNATRCVAALLEPHLGRDRITLETAGGILTSDILADGQVRVDMGAPRFGWAEIPLAREIDPARLELGPDADGLGHGFALSMGNPHCVFLVPDFEGLDIETRGPRLEHHALFPERANIGFGQVISPTHIRLRVWERGAALTQACGSGACAGAVAAMSRGLTERRVTVELDGGPLEIHWQTDDHVVMTGPVATSFEGTVDLSDGLSGEDGR